MDDAASVWNGQLAWAVDIVFETHALTVDNENGIATVWRDGQLSEQGRALAAELGEHRRDDGLAALFASVWGATSRSGL